MLHYSMYRVKTHLFSPESLNYSWSVLVVARTVSKFPIVSFTPAENLERDINRALRVKTHRTKFKITELLTILIELVGEVTMTQGV